MRGGKSFSVAEIVQFLGAIPMAGGVYLLVFAGLAKVLGGKWTAGFSLALLRNFWSAAFGSLLLFGAGLLLLYAGGCLGRRNETVLRQRLEMLRSLIARFRAERGRNPSSLQELAKAGYLTKIPRDPVAWLRGNWREIGASQGGGIVDVRSHSHSQAMDGSSYDEW